MDYRKFSIKWLFFSNQLHQEFDFTRYLSSDVVYVVLFPQLTLVIYGGDYTNTYGSLAAFVTGFTLRVLSIKLFNLSKHFSILKCLRFCVKIGGEKLLSLPAVIHFPFYDEESKEQLFPFRTFLMLSSVVVQLVVSGVAKSLFRRGCLSPRFDVFGCFFDVDNKPLAVSANQSDAVMDEEQETFLRIPQQIVNS